MEWVNSFEQLPELVESVSEGITISKPVLCYTKYGTMVVGHVERVVSCRSKRVDIRWVLSFGAVYGAGYVLYWMLLPDDPPGMQASVVTKDTRGNVNQMLGRARQPKR